MLLQVRVYYTACKTKFSRPFRYASSGRLGGQREQLFINDWKVHITSVDGVSDIDGMEGFGENTLAPIRLAVDDLGIRPIDLVRFVQGVFSQGRLIRLPQSVGRSVLFGPGLEVVLRLTDVASPAICALDAINNTTNLIKGNRVLGEAEEGA